jgi:nucleoside-diphosphate-sugar epimerase
VRSDRAAGQVINVACGSRFTLNELLSGLRLLTGSDQEATYVEARAGDIKHSLGDISAARNLLGYEPGVSFEDGLKKTAEWFRERSS